MYGVRAVAAALLLIETTGPKKNFRRLNLLDAGGCLQERQASAHERGCNRIFTKACLAVAPTCRCNALTAAGPCLTRLSWACVQTCICDALGLLTL